MNSVIAENVVMTDTECVLNAIAPISIIGGSIHFVAFNQIVGAINLDRTADVIVSECPMINAITRPITAPAIELNGIGIGAQQAQSIDNPVLGSHTVWVERSVGPTINGNDLAIVSG